MTLRSRARKINDNIASSSRNHSIPVNFCQVDMQTLEKSITNIVRSELDKAVAKVETRVHNAVFTAMD